MFFTPHAACFGLIQIRGGKKEGGGGSWKGTQYNLDYQQPHPLWATAIPWRVKKPVCNGIFLLTHLQQWWYCRMKYGI